MEVEPQLQDLFPQGSKRPFLLCFYSLKSPNLPQKTSLAQSREEPDQKQATKSSLPIQVKKKPLRDPELDWFVDMIPEMKPAAILLLPELRAEMMVPKDDVSPLMEFSSKSAAAEITQGESEGWEGAGGLS
ncbi:hypothetical protein GH733_015470 [Mirounga leonina]|nr:hypothetical protein GH733_015470 [Mirounga leonina]